MHFPLRKTGWLAAVLAGGDGATLSHQAASVVHRFEIQRVRPVVSTPHSRHPEIAGVTWHRTRRHQDVITINGIPVTTRARTMIDNAAVLPYEVFEKLLQNAVTSGRLQIEEMLVWPDALVAVEGEGRRWHGNAYQAMRTRERARTITATGIDLYAYGWSEATETPLAVCAEVERVVLGRLNHRRAG